MNCASYIHDSSDDTSIIYTFTNLKGLHISLYLHYNFGFLAILLELLVFKE